MTFISLINEKELLLRLKQEDRMAFETLYRHYLDAIFRKILYLVKSEDIAEEITQDVFLKIWEKRNLIDPEKSFSGYIYAIAQNMVTDMYRKCALDRRLEDHLKYMTTELYLPKQFPNEEKDNFELLLEAMSSLSVQRKKVVALIKLEGRSYKEVGFLLGITPATVRDHMVKGTKALKKYFAGNPLILLSTLLCALLF